MAKDKKSFTAYTDWIDTFDELSDEEAGKLIKHLLKYVNDLNPEAPDRVTKLLFTPMKATLKRDLKKWENKRQQNSANAKKRWDKKDTNECDRMQMDAKHAVSVSVSDSVSVSTVVDDKKAIAKIKVIDPESFYPTSKLVEEYLKNEKLCEIITKNPKNKLKNKTELKNRLLEFEGVLNEKGRLVETWNEFAKYFLNWNLKNMQMTKHIVPKEKFISNPYRENQ